MPSPMCSWRTTRAAVVALDERRVHDRHRFGDRAHDREADEVREAHLAAAGPPEVAVDDRAVHLEQPGRHLAEARGRRDVEALLHVGHDAGAAPRSGWPSSPASGWLRGAGAGAVFGRERACVSGGRRRAAGRPPVRAGRAGSPRRTPASCCSPTWGRRGTARTSRRPATRWARARSRFPDLHPSRRRSYRWTDPAYRAWTRSQYAAQASASSASWMSRTFSALSSPECEQLYEPVSTQSSQTTSLACM